MSPRLKFILTAIVGSVLAVVLGFGIADESYALAAVIGLLLIWTMIEWRGGARPEAWVLGGAVFGYIVGNRGFAQLWLTGQLPILPAEAALGVGVATLFFRAAFQQTGGTRRDLLNGAVALWLAVGAARLPMDLGTYGLLALRDSAVVYYGLFFFVGQAVAMHVPSRQLIRRALIAAFILLPPLYWIDGLFPGFLFSIQIRGIPFFYYKEDLVAAYFFSGFFFLLAEASPVAPWRIAVAATSYASAFAIGSSRAAMAGLLVTSCWWFGARRWLPLKLQAALVPFGIGGLLLIAVVSSGSFYQSRFYALYEHTASMFDVTGTGSYQNENRMYVGDNNRFRLAWWTAVAEETWETNPVLGLGFGADLSLRFVRTYEMGLGDDFNTRSPHSIFFTMLGRLGAIGVAAWLALVIGMTARTAKLVAMARNDAAALPALGWWSVSWVVFVSSCFGVVMEGPMGAVLFWTALGFANALTAEAEHRLRAADDVALTAAAAPVGLRDTETETPALPAITSSP